MSKSNRHTTPSALRRRQRWDEYRKVLRQASVVPLPEPLALSLKDPDEMAKLGRPAAVWVQLYRDEHGYGPTWRELGEAIHPDCAHVCAAQAPAPVPAWAVAQNHAGLLTSALVRHRWVQSTKAARSLRPGIELGEIGLG